MLAKRASWNTPQRLLTALLLACICILTTPPPHAQATSDLNIEGLPPALADKAQIHIAETTPPTSLFSAQRETQQTADILARLLESEGYLAAQIETWNENDETLSRGVRITPGTRFTTTAPNLTYTATPPDAETQTALSELASTLPSGSPARAEPILDLSKTLLATLQRAGYPDATIAPVDAVADAQTHTLDLNFEITQGLRATFGEIAVVGLDRTRLDFIYDLKPWRAGDTYTPDQMDTFRKRLSATGLFNHATVELYEDAGNAATYPGERIVAVTIEERPRRSIALGATASTSEGFGGEAEWNFRNYSGRADTLSFYSQISTLERRLETRYDRPHTGEYDRDLQLVAKIEDFETDAFDQTGGSIAATIDEQFTQQLSGTIGAEIGYASINDTKARQDGTDRRNLSYISGLISAEYTGVDDILDPDKGLRARLSLEPGVTEGDTRIGFTRISAEASTYHQLGTPNLIAAARLHLGTIAGPNGAPPDKLFFAGGGGSVRGYEYQSLSPRDTNGELVGGRSLVEASAELRWRASERLGYTAFVDVGSASLNLEPDFSDLRAGAGIGLRYYAGFGPLRADIAVPLDKRTGDADFQVYLSIGHAF